MANPKHTNPAQPRRDGSWAHAPYNFIPLPEKVVTVIPEDIPDHDSYKFPFETFTGYLDCTLITESPTFTRRGMNREFFQKWADKSREMMQDAGAREEYAQFFSLDDVERPIIPGSSLRGMVRSLVEIAGYGKMQWVTERRLFFRTVDATAVGDYYGQRMADSVEAGFLRQRGLNYYIKKCQISRVAAPKLGTGRNSLYQGAGPNKTPVWSGKPHQYQPVWVQLSENQRLVTHLQYSADARLREGRLIITGDIPKKKKEFVFLLPEQDAEEVPVSQEIIERFHDDDQLTQWQMRAFPSNEPRHNARQKDGYLCQNLTGEGDPVFFLRENNTLTFFGRAQMFRLPYSRSPMDLVPPHLCPKDEIDLVEAIFGYIPTESGKPGRAGRVYFSDARFQNAQGDIWLPEGTITPRILGSPKPTTFQHYLVQDKAKNHNPDDIRNLAHYGTTPEGTIIRGHKLYWHQGSADLKEIEENTPVNWAEDTQHTRIRPVNRGVSFRFRVHFENLRDYELGALLWVLDLPPDCRHKIGLGKPLGLGSVHISPRLILSNRQIRYSRLFSGGQWVTGEQEKSNLSEFKQTFESFVLARIDERERKSSFGEVERIKMLLAMLQWPGPDKELTKYMTVRPNEYLYRPVLPDPLHVESQPLPPDRSRLTGPARPQPQKTGAGFNPETTSRPGLRRAPEKPGASSAGPGLELPEVGDSFTEQIIQIRTNGDVVVRYKNLPTDQVFAFIPAGEAGGKQYRVGNQARCQVIEKYKQGDKWVLKCKPAPKREK